jgi:hypothetical protein
MTLKITIHKKLFVSLTLYFLSRFMKRILFLFILCLSGKLILAQNTEQVKGNENGILSTPLPDSSLKIMEESYDFGKIPQGKPVHHNFEIINTGKSAMKLVNVQASCGCTTPEWEKDKDIPSNGKSIIKVGYNAASEGVFTKNITITYNENQTKLITIKGEVWKTPSASAPSNSTINDLKD